MAIDYDKWILERSATIFIGPTGAATGIQDLAEPTAAELNNTGGVSGVVNASPSVSYSDTDLGVQESERLNDPSFADESTYEDFGQINYGGSVSFYYPKDYDDNSNNHSLLYDMTDAPRTKLDVAMRVDGDKKTTDAAANGDFVHAFRVLSDAEANSLQGADALRRTVTMLSQGAVAVYTIVGAHTITAVAPSTFAAGDKGRIRATVQDRDYTNALTFSSSDNSVIQVYPGGFFEVTGSATDTATVTIEDEAAGTSTTVAVTVS